MDLFTQATNLGILTEFIDGQGHRHVTDETALKIIVDAFPARTPRRLLDGAVVIRTGQPARTGSARAQLAGALDDRGRRRVIAERRGR